MSASRRAPVLVCLAVLAVIGCRVAPEIPTVLVRANDYAYTTPDSVPAGRTAFGLENLGKVPHELIIVRLRPEADLQAIMRLEQADSSWRAMRDAPSGILTADPGVTTPGSLLLDLQAGERYLLLCNFQDSDSAPPHLRLGMLKLVTVHGASRGP